MRRFNLVKYVQLRLNDNVFWFPVLEKNMDKVQAKVQDFKSMVGIDISGMNHPPLFEFVEGLSGGEIVSTGIREEWILEIAQSGGLDVVEFSKQPIIHTTLPSSAELFYVDELLILTSSIKAIKRKKIDSFILEAGFKIQDVDSKAKLAMFDNWRLPSFKEIAQWNKNGLRKNPHFIDLDFDEIWTIDKKGNKKVFSLDKAKYCRSNRGQLVLVHECIVDDLFAIGYLCDTNLFDVPDMIEPKDDPMGEDLTNRSM